MGKVSKRGLVRMNKREVEAGRRAWAQAGNKGRLAPGSFDFERTAQKTWIRYVDGTGEERAVIECELYVQPNVDGSGELVGMLHGMCPCCGETFIVREENKEMSLGAVRFDQAPRWLKVHWTHHLAEKHGLKKGLRLETLGRLPSFEEMVRPPQGADAIPIVSGTNRVDEPWVCDHCHKWGVYVYESVARDMERAPTGSQIISHRRADVPAEPRPASSTLEV
jgi:hypothetical protein